MPVDFKNAALMPIYFDVFNVLLHIHVYHPLNEWRTFDWCTNSMLGCKIMLDVSRNKAARW
jgi:hypothetical protein